MPFDFNGDINDYKLNNILTKHNVTWQQGIIQQGIHFNGSNTTGKQTNIVLQNTKYLAQNQTNMTLCFWFKIQGRTETGSGYYFTQQQNLSVK